MELFFLLLLIGIMAFAHEMQKRTRIDPAAARTHPQHHRFCYRWSIPHSLEPNS